MKSKYDYDIIRDYLHGLVDRETARRIRELIRLDEVARDIAAGILRLEHEFGGNEDEVEAYIERLRQKQMKLIDEDSRRGTSRGWIRLAAAILLIAVSGFVLWLTVFRGGNTLDDELRQPYPLAVIDRGEDEVNAGYEFYGNKEYKKAIASFDKVTNDVSVTFYNGLSHLYVGEYDQAATLLGSESLQTSRYREQAEWFRCLALLKGGRKDEAKDGLAKVRDNTTHYKSSVAGELLSSLVE